MLLSNAGASVAVSMLQVRALGLRLGLGLEGDVSDSLMGKPEGKDTPGVSVPEKVGIDPLKVTSWNTQLSSYKHPCSDTVIWD